MDGFDQKNSTCLDNSTNNNNDAINSAIPSRSDGVFCVEKGVQQLLQLQQKLASLLFLRQQQQQQHQKNRGDNEGSSSGMNGNGHHISRNDGTRGSSRNSMIDSTISYNNGSSNGDQTDISNIEKQQPKHASLILHKEDGADLLRLSPQLICAMLIQRLFFACRDGDAVAVEQLLHVAQSLPSSTPATPSIIADTPTNSDHVRFSSTSNSRDNLEVYGSPTGLYRAVADVINYQEYNGRTLLHVAAAGGHVDTVKLLLAAGANPSICDRAGQTPHDVASHAAELQRRHQQISASETSQDNPQTRHGKCADFSASNERYGDVMACLVEHTSHQVPMLTVGALRSGRVFTPLPPPELITTGAAGSSAPLPGGCPATGDGVQPVSGAGGSFHGASSNHSRDRLALAIHAPRTQDEGLCIILVGLPARGKSFVATRIMRYCHWCSIPSNIVNVMVLEAQLAQRNTPTAEPLNVSEDESPSTESVAAWARQTAMSRSCHQGYTQVSQEVNTDMEMPEDLLQAVAGQAADMCVRHGGVSIIYGTGASPLQRAQLRDRLVTGLGVAETRCIFLELTNSTDEIVETHIKFAHEEAVRSRGLELVGRYSDFRTVYLDAIERHSKGYQSLPANDTENNYTFVRFEDRTTLSLHLCEGVFLTRLVYMLQNLSRRYPHPIFFCRPGEWEDWVGGRLGGGGTVNSLTKAGQKFAERLAAFFEGTLLSLVSRDSLVGDEDDVAMGESSVHQRRKSNNDDTAVDGVTVIGSSSPKRRVGAIIAHAKESVERVYSDTNVCDACVLATSSYHDSPNDAILRQSSSRDGTPFSPSSDHELKEESRNSSQQHMLQPQRHPQGDFAIHEKATGEENWRTNVNRMHINSRSQHSSNSSLYDTDDMSSSTCDNSKIIAREAEGADVLQDDECAAVLHGGGSSDDKRGRCRHHYRSSHAHHTSGRILLLHSAESCARETVEPLMAGPLGKYITRKALPTLNDVNHGDCERRTMADIKHVLPKTLAGVLENPYDNAWPNGESVRQVFETRLEPHIHEIQACDRPVVVVAHERILQGLIYFYTYVHKMRKEGVGDVSDGAASSSTMGPRRALDTPVPFHSVIMVGPHGRKEVNDLDVPITSLRNQHATT